MGPDQHFPSGPIQAAMLLGRWTRIAERHGGGCSCCPGLGDVAIDEVERRVSEWLAQRHRLDGTISTMLRPLVIAKAAVPARKWAGTWGGAAGRARAPNPAA